MSSDEIDCLREAKDMFANLNSWKEESHKQISRIINSRSSSISTGINTLLEEIRGLQNELSCDKEGESSLARDS